MQKTVEEQIAEEADTPFVIEAEDDEDDNELPLDSVPTCLGLLRAQWALLKDVPATLRMHYFEMKPSVDEYFANASERIASAWTAARRAWEGHRQAGNSAE